MSRFDLTRWFLPKANNFLYHLETFIKSADGSSEHQVQRFAEIIDAHPHPNGNGIDGRDELFADNDLFLGCPDQCHPAIRAPVAV